MNGREILLSMLKGGDALRPPVMPISMMFAADQTGRAYGEYAKDFRVMAEAQLLTAERFGFDHVSAISDPAREAADFGAKIHWFNDQPPAVDESEALLADKSKLVALKFPDPLGGGRMHDRVLGVELLKRKSAGRFFIEGWVEGPCAEAADLRGINSIMLDFYDDPQFMKDLFSLAVENAVNFARCQIEAGADIIGVGDAAASLLGPEIYGDFVFPYERELVERIHALGGFVRLHICGNIGGIIGRMGELGADIIDVDSMVPMRHARESVGSSQVLLGNISPVEILRNGSPELVRSGLAKCLAEAGPRYVAGAGCEIPRGTPPENVLAISGFSRSCLK